MSDRSRRWPSRTSLTVPGEEPSRLTREGKALVRVRGTCHGVVWCAGQRLWCWGPFARAFEVPARAGVVRVQALGLLGVRSARVELDPRAELREPRVRSRPLHAPRAELRPLRYAAQARPPIVTARAPQTRADAVPAPRRLAIRMPSPVLRALRVALRLPAPGDPR